MQEFLSYHSNSNSGSKTPKLNSTPKIQMTPQALSIGKATPLIALAPSLARKSITFATSVEVILGVSPTGLWSSQMGLGVLSALVYFSGLGLGGWKVGILPKSSKASFVEMVVLLESFDVRFHR